MTIRKIIGFIATLAIFAVAIVIGRALWVHYMDEPWTRDGRVRAEVINIAPDVSGAVVELPVHDNQLVKKGDLLFRIEHDTDNAAGHQLLANLAKAKAVEINAAQQWARGQALLPKDFVPKATVD